jgi:hypothetical protein
VEEKNKNKGEGLTYDPTMGPNFRSPTRETREMGTDGEETHPYDPTLGTNFRSPTIKNISETVSGKPKGLNFIGEMTTPNLSNSAYVRVKVFKKPILAKMLIDSGNLVDDLISEEFARLLKVKYTPEEKSVGTAAKGGSVKIIGRSEPIKIFIENIPQAVTIIPLIVKDLAHPVNVGRDFLGRTQGKLEYNPRAGYLELKGSKVKLISKSTPMDDPAVTDTRIKRVMKEIANPLGGKGTLIYERGIYYCQESVGKPKETPVFVKGKVELPAHTALFVPLTTKGVWCLEDVQEKCVMVEQVFQPDQEEGSTLLLPGVCTLVSNTLYGLVMNMSMSRVKLDEDQPIGLVSMMEPSEYADRPSTENHGRVGQERAEVR